LQGPPKFTQVGIFGLKRCHLATLMVVYFSSFFLFSTYPQNVFYAQGFFRDGVLLGFLRADFCVEVGRVPA
jgi:hypothetical protein